MNHLKRLALALLLSVMASTTAFALTIDYSYVSTHNYSALGQKTYDAIGQQSWLFTHASVGGNMMGGMAELHSSDPSKYQLQKSTTRSSTAPAGTPGTIYDWHRGNPGWQNKYNIFKSAVEAGWGNSADFVMDKLCYIDQSADVDVYLKMMDELDDSYSATFAYTTLPIKKGSGSSNDLRNKYNQAVREYASLHNKLLFDIADLEAHSRLGEEATYVSKDGNTYQQMYDPWTYDGGHLNTAGRNWVAEGWYAVAASQVAPTPIPGTALLLGCGLSGLAAFRRKFSSANAA